MNRALLGPRGMNLPVPSYVGQYVDGSGFPAANGWTQVDNVIYHENYFDLSGYQLDNDTLFPELIALQDPGLYSTSDTAPDAQMMVLDVVSMERLDIPQVVADVTDNSIGLNLPSMPTSTYDWTQIMYGQFRYLIPQTLNNPALNYLQVVTGCEFGSGSPTTVAKLWTYRIVIPLSTDLSNVTITIPATRFIMSAVIGHEPDLAFMMRQKRSYELSTTS